MVGSLLACYASGVGGVSNSIDYDIRLRSSRPCLLIYHPLCIKKKLIIILANSKMIIAERPLVSKCL